MCFNSVLGPVKGTEGVRLREGSGGTGGGERGASEEARRGVGPGAPWGADESAGLRARLPCSPPAAESASLTLTPSSLQEGASFLLETELTRILQVSVPENGLHLRNSF